MKIKSLVLHNFRIFPSKSFQFGQNTLIVGANGVGKTSVIEAISLLANGGSFRAGRIEHMISLGEELGRVVGEVEVEQESVKLEVMLTRGQVQGRRTQHRLFSVNDIRRRKRDFCTHFFAVTFRPEDLRLIEGSPSRRRSFLDSALSAVDYEYQRSLKVYEQTLKRRNRLLWQIREGEQSKSVLSYWNLALIKHGEVIQDKRRHLIRFLESVSSPFHFSVTYKPSIISEKRVNQYLNKEIMVGHTLIGPHKDDFELKFSVKKEEQEVGLAIYGSRGQQRLGVLWLKLGELEFLTRQTEQLPVLLLDDILSELDTDSRQMVLDLLGRYQVIITTADPDLILEIKNKARQLKVIKISQS